MALNTADPEAVRSAAREILDDPQFPNHDPSLFDQVMYWVTHPAEALEYAISWVLGHLIGTGPGTFISWIVVLAFLAGVVFAVVMLTRSTRHDNSVPVTFATSSGQKTAAEFLAEAAAFEQNAQWRDAIRMRYAAVLADLGQAGIVRLRPGRTTGEYLGEVRENLPDGAEVFGDVTIGFELAWYGSAETTQGDLERFKDVAGRVKAKVRA